MTFGDLIKMLEAYDPNDLVCGIIGITDLEQDIIIRYSSGHELPGWNEWLENADKAPV